MKPRIKDAVISKYINDELIHIYVDNTGLDERTATHDDERYKSIQLRDLKHDYDHLIRLMCKQCKKQYYRSKGIPNATECTSCKVELQYKCMECPKFSPSFSAAKNHLIYHCKPYFRYECQACDYVTHSKKNMLQHFSYTKRVRGPAKKRKASPIESLRAAAVAAAAAGVAAAVKKVNYTEKENFCDTELDKSLFSTVSRQVSVHEMSYLAAYMKVKCPNNCNDPPIVYQYDQEKCCKSCDSEYTFTCTICDKQSKNDKVTGSHIKVKHVLKNLERKMRCNICDAKFCFREDLNSHVRLTHRKGNKLNGKIHVSFTLF